MCNTLGSGQAHTKDFTKEFTSAAYYICIIKKKKGGKCLTTRFVAMWQYFHSGLFWAKKKKVEQTEPSLRAYARISVFSCLLRSLKLHVSLPSHYWLQHRTDSWYTCSIRESEPRFPVTDQWTTMHTLAFCLYLQLLLHWTQTLIIV